MRIGLRLAFPFFFRLYRKRHICSRLYWRKTFKTLFKNRERERGKGRPTSGPRKSRGNSRKKKIIIKTTNCRSASSWRWSMGKPSWPWFDKVWTWVSDVSPSQNASGEIGDNRFRVTASISSVPPLPLISFFEKWGKIASFVTCPLYKGDDLIHSDGGPFRRCSSSEKSIDRNPDAP